MNKSSLKSKIQKDLRVSEKVARALLVDYLMFIQDIELDIYEFRIGIGGDPAKAYDRRMRRVLLFQRMECGTIMASVYRTRKA